jgi:hypothetical protein
MRDGSRRATRDQPTRRQHFFIALDQWAETHIASRMSSLDADPEQG